MTTAPTLGGLYILNFSCLFSFFIFFFFFKGTPFRFFSRSIGQLEVLEVLANFYLFFFSFSYFIFFCGLFTVQCKCTTSLWNAGHCRVTPSGYPLSVTAYCVTQRTIYRWHAQPSLTCGKHNFTPCTYISNRLLVRCASVLILWSPIQAVGHKSPIHWLPWVQRLVYVLWMRMRVGPIWMHAACKKYVKIAFLHLNTKPTYRARSRQQIFRTCNIWHPKVVQNLPLTTAVVLPGWVNGIISETEYVFHETKVACVIITDSNSH